MPAKLQGDDYDREASMNQKERSLKLKIGIPVSISRVEKR
jgi:hypothetical protein